MFHELHLLGLDFHVNMTAIMNVQRIIHTSTTQLEQKINHRVVAVVGCVWLAVSL